jgi:endonuclease/exonuclease/phosphatase family metal-dependent hydrolase
MNRRSLLLMVAAMFLMTMAYAQQYTVGSYNLRFANTEDSGNLWVDRAPAVAELIRFHGYDVLGTQEGLLSQLEDLSRLLPQYSRYGVGRNDGKDAGEHSAIFYKTEKFELLNKGDFWLSQTPDTPSLGWDATCCNRLCSWVQLKDKKTGKIFYFFNAHYDHQGKVAREESSRLILQKIQAIAGKTPTLFTGDLNGGHSTACYTILENSGYLKDAYNKTTVRYANNGSFNGFKSKIISKELIDHVFVTSAFSVQQYAVLTDTYYGKFPSDHFPVWVRVTLSKNK